jgi:hypothetical protein
MREGVTSQTTSQFARPRIDVRALLGLYDPADTTDWGPIRAAQMNAGSQLALFMLAANVVGAALVTLNFAANFPVWKLASWSALVAAVGVTVAFPPPGSAPPHRTDRKPQRRARNRARRHLARRGLVDRAVVLRPLCQRRSGRSALDHPVDPDGRLSGRNGRAAACDDRLSCRARRLCRDLARAHDRARARRRVDAVHRAAHHRLLLPRQGAGGDPCERDRPCRTRRDRQPAAARVRGQGFRLAVGDRRAAPRGARQSALRGLARRRSQGDQRDALPPGAGRHRMGKRQFLARAARDGRAAQAARAVPRPAASPSMSTGSSAGGR